MKNSADKFVAGIVAIGIVAAIGIHSDKLPGLITQVFRSAGLIEKTAING